MASRDDGHREDGHREDGHRVDDGHRVEVHLDRLLADRGLTLVELSERVGISVVNLSVLKNGRARAIRFSTLSALCHALDCAPGDLLTVAPPQSDGRTQHPAPGPAQL